MVREPFATGTVYRDFREYPDRVNRPPRVWTSTRRLMGNLIPALVWLPTVAIGFYIAVTSGDPGGAAILWILGGTVAAWLVTNWFGFYQNARMQRELRRFLLDPPDDDAEFVGFARPSYGSFVDAHEDVGFLLILPDRLKFVSENRSVQVFRVEIQRIHFRPNVHSMIGLGRWIAIEGTSDGQRIRLLVEPRRYSTMVANLLYSRRLAQNLRNWYQSVPKNS